MAVFPAMSPHWSQLRAKTRSTAPRSPRLRLRTRSSRFRRHSAVLSSSFASFFCTIFHPARSSSETQSQTSSRVASDRPSGADFSSGALAPFSLPMNAQESAAPLVAVVGPTASGKSALAVFLAGKLGGEVIACDSTQLYRRFNIGTAKPDETERRGVPHHLLDVYEPEQISTAGEYRRLALEVLEDLRRRKRLPILTVGTGLYLRALLEGLAETPLRSEDLRKRLAADSRGKGPDYLHSCLRRLDREAAARIAPRDHQKLVRAIEVCVLAGKRITEVHRTGRARLEGFHPVKIGLNPPRPELSKRIRWRAPPLLAPRPPEPLPPPPPPPPPPPSHPPPPPP